MILCLADKRNVTIRAISSHLQALGQDILWLDTADFIQNVVVSDKIIDGLAEVTWTIYDRVVSPQTTSGVLNFLYHVPLSVCEEFGDNDRDYVRHEWEAYLRFAINQYSNVINPPWGGSLSGFCQSLPYQWMFIKKSSQDILVPEWTFSPLNRLSDYARHNCNLIISENIYDGKHWITKHDTSNLEDKWFLFYQRPQGIPQIVTALDEHLWIEPLGGSREKTKFNEQSIREICRLCMNHYQLRLAHFLFFFDPYQNTITFGSCGAGVQIGNLPPTEREQFVEIIGRKLIGAQELE